MGQGQKIHIPCVFLYFRLYYGCSPFSNYQIPSFLIIQAESLCLQKSTILVFFAPERRCSMNTNTLELSLLICFGFVLLTFYLLRRRSRSYQLQCFFIQQGKVRSIELLRQLNHFLCQEALAFRLESCQQDAALKIWKEHIEMLFNKHLMSRKGFVLLKILLPRKFEVHDAPKIIENAIKDATEEIKRLFP